MFTKLAIGGSLFLIAVSIAVSSSLAYYIKNASSNGSYGEIGLRSYFERGSGSEGEPYVITRPRHMYNLSKLQSLGVFSEKTYFQLGLVGLAGSNENLGPLCYVSDSSNEVTPFLDMSESSYDHEPIYSIGSEAVPFYGEFDGQDIEIKNLNVYADPEDSGLFGYTASGSSVHDLFLSNITINTMGYTSAYESLYGPNSTLNETVTFVYNLTGESDGATIVFDHDSTEYDIVAFTADRSNQGFVHDENAGDRVPTLTYTTTNSNYSYAVNVSGALLSNSNGTISPNLTELFAFFKQQMDQEDASYPMQASTSVSIVAYNLDSYGQTHSKSLLTLSYLFTMESADATGIGMEVRVGSQHTNNIGLVIGHCDGSIKDCYVYNGAFKMNNGSTLSGGTYTALENRSSLGLVGLVGNTVRNLVAEESGGSTTAGKNVGVLDFTTIYDDIIDSSSFSSSESIGAGGISYSPRSGNKYTNYLRKNLSDQYVTESENTVAFAGQKIIKNTDLGVFTVGTDYYANNGTGASNRLDSSIVRKEETDVDGGYYLYYATGEYQRSAGYDYRKNYKQWYRSNSYPSTGDEIPQIFQGRHLPKAEETTWESFAYRELHQNYIFRFKLDPYYRKTRGLYFSDLDTSSIGGSFLAKYFRYKLVDQNSQPIPIGSRNSGVMLRDSFGNEIKKLISSFSLPDQTGSNTNIICINNSAELYPAANTVNFEIKTEYANITVVARPEDAYNDGGDDDGASIGVYELTDSPNESGNSKILQKQSYDPKYAFFMPGEKHLSYFDYNVINGSGKIGTYDSSGNFTEVSSSAAPSYAPRANGAEAEYKAGTRLFVHTFKLPQGRYCLSSADNRAKIYYICAQGQSEGQIEFNDTIYAGSNSVESVDFLKSPRFDPDTKAELVTLDGVSTYNPAGNELLNKRLYVTFLDSDRSSFASSPAPSQLTFLYDPESAKFLISSSQPSAMTHIAVSNYDHSLAGDSKSLTVSLMGNESSGSTLFYSYEA
ncbi:MAG: hypothetical protein K6B65_00115 [Bacilli bacterium]|nr:hypothetical protein [Bacilli bacterium]